jgi:DnaK suppressor protein
MPMKYLDPIETARLRELLLLREAALAAAVDAALAAERDRANPGRAVDAALVDWESALRIADIRRDVAELSAIRAALTRMDRGRYGRCLSCGAHIPIERLRADPAATLCQVCQCRVEEDHGPSSWAS